MLTLVKCGTQRAFGHLFGSDLPLVPGYLMRWEQALLVPLEDESLQPTDTYWGGGIPVPAAPLGAVLMVCSFS